MDLENNVYSPETLISRYTNRAVSTTVSKNAYPIFWCDICNLKLSVLTIAIQHLTGRPHKARVNAKKGLTNESNINERKRGLDSSKIKPVGQVIQEPATKKSKEQTVKTVDQQPNSTKNKKEKPAKAVVQQSATKKSKEQPAKEDPNLKCDDCNLVFASIATAIPHFKGKKHISAIAAKLAAKQSQNQKEKGGQRGGRGRGAGRGRARGVTVGGRGRGRGDGLGREGTAGELLRAIKTFYGNPFYNAPHNDFSGNSRSDTPQNEQRNYVDGVQVNDDVYDSNYPPSNYGAPRHLKEHFASSNVESQENVYKSGQLKDIYDTHQVPPNYYDSPTPKDNFSHRYYSGNGSNTYYNPNEA